MFTFAENGIEANVYTDDDIGHDCKFLYMIKQDGKSYRLSDTVQEYAIWVYWSRVISACHPSVLKLQRRR